MNRLFDYRETNVIRAHPVILGSLTIVTLICTFLIDTGMSDGAAAWAPYCIAIVLALQWKGAAAIVPVTASALLLLIAGFLLEPPGDLQAATTNRAIGAGTLTTLAIVCLYIDWRRSKHRETFTATVSRMTQLQLFVDGFKQSAIGLTDLRGRVTAWNQTARKLTGHSMDQVIGQPVFRVCFSPDPGTDSWSQICRKARLEGVTTHEAICRRQDGTQRPVYIAVKPLRNNVGQLYGYSLTIHNPTSSLADVMMESQT